MKTTPQDASARQPFSPTVPCDLCGYPMALPQHCIEQGEILGMLVCTQCIEDHLESQTHAH